jgi:hypothetical protein
MNPLATAPTWNRPLARPGPWKARGAPAALRRPQSTGGCAGASEAAGGLGTGAATQHETSATTHFSLLSVLPRGWHALLAWHGAAGYRLAISASSASAAAKRQAKGQDSYGRCNNAFIMISSQQLALPHAQRRPQQQPPADPPCCDPPGGGGCCCWPWWLSISSSCRVGPVGLSHAAVTAAAAAARPPSRNDTSLAMRPCGPPVL